MKLNTYVLLSLTGVFTPGATKPMPASFEAAFGVPGTMKRKNPSFEAASVESAVVGTRDIPNIEVQIRDPAKIERRELLGNIETRDNPNIAVQIRDPAKIDDKL